MIKGLGVDLSEINRIEKAVKRNHRFPKRILSDREMELFEGLTSWKRKVEFVAGRFAAKEAYSKAQGTGIGKEYSFQDIEILPNFQGKPEVFVKGRKEEGTLVSISHSTEIVIAEVVIQEG
ncbi:holo-[acyl-carrier protein] synthase [Salinibacillus kushneri]|uniref:Holo-[acyl-carrier-protein] synthase n=1 Tax=Salinibacillus kushneri TaxID=237682 RepID=A0A1I0BH63_9BACI|nr:holo-ACP synthase [Salinibacillus kushneri]SET06326.1 holo-[acyl-carrier protein] synthase [Salinibacillus kushneri]